MIITQIGLFLAVIVAVAGACLPPFTSPEPTTGPPSCADYVKADLYFLLDSSNSINSIGWGRELAFVVNTTKAFKFGPNDVQVSFGIFSSEFKHLINLNTYKNYDDFARYVLGTAQLKQLTYTFDALNRIRTDGYLTSALYGARSDVPKILIVITDGQSQDINRTIAEADELRGQNIKILSIGVGVTNQVELQGIAGGNDQNVFSVHNFAALDSIREQITLRICDVTPEQTTTTPEPTTTTPEPTTTTPEPTTTTPEPTTTTPEPTTTTPEPTTTTPEPTTTTPEPTTTTPEPTTTTPEPATTPEPTTREPSCADYVKADLYFLLDSSNSINSVGWGREKAFVVNTTKAFNFGPNDVQVAYGIFSTEFIHIINLNTYKNYDDFAQDVLGTAQLKQLTYTFDALNRIRTDGYLTSALYGARPGIPKILIVITDGQSQNITKTKIAADDLRAKNITILSIGVGVTNRVELQEIAGDDKNVFSVHNFAALDSIKDQITRRICDAPSDPPVVPCPSSVQIDLVIAVDSSTTTSLEDYERNSEFVANLIRGFTVNDGSARVALLVYGTDPQPVFQLTSSFDKIYQNLLVVPYLNSSANSHLALLEAWKLLTPAYGGRVGVNKTIVLVSHSKSVDPSKTLEVAEKLRGAVVNIFTLGVTPGADIKELSSLASRYEYNFPVADFNALVPFARQVAVRACSAPTPPPPVIICPAAIKVDIFFVIDSSGSIGSQNYHYNFEFIERILKSYYIAENGTKVALWTYGTSVRPRFRLSADRDYIEQQLQNVPYQGSTTNTHLALRYVITSGWNTPANGARPDARKVIILVTDGRSSVPSETLLAAAEVKAQNITIAVVGVTDAVDQNELLAVASEPTYVVNVNNYEFLDYFASSISDIACNKTSA